MSQRISTKHYAGIVDSQTAIEVYNYLRDNIEWEDGSRSKKGYTRKIRLISLGDDSIVDTVIENVMIRLCIDKSKIKSLYLDYYRNSNDWCPNRTHKNTKQ